MNYSRQTPILMVKKICEIAHLVGGWPTPLKNDEVRQLGISFPTEWKNKFHPPNHQTDILYPMYSPS